MFSFDFVYLINVIVRLNIFSLNTEILKCVESADFELLGFKMALGSKRKTSDLTGRIKLKFLQTCCGLCSLCSMAGLASHFGKQLC